MVSFNRRVSLLAGRKSSLHRTFASFVFLLLLVSCASTLALAQSVTGSISGVVVDPNGAVVPGATITLVKDETNDKRNQPSNESGRFNFASLQPGVYSLRIEHAGF